MEYPQGFEGVVIPMDCAPLLAAMPPLSLARLSRYCVFELPLAVEVVLKRRTAVFRQMIYINTMLL